MKVTDGALTREFQTLRLPLGTGLLAWSPRPGAAYFTEDYAADERFVHKGYIDEAVAGEQIRAILGVPLVLDGVVIGALLAVHRSVRRFPQSEVSLLTSFAAHAVVALENARLFAELDEANRSLTRHTEAVDAAALAHDRLTDLLLGGGGVAEVAEVLSGVLDGAVSGVDARGRAAGGRGPGLAWADAVPGAVASGRSVVVERRAGRRRPRRHRARRHPGAAARRAARPRRSPYARARRDGHRAGAALRPVRQRRRGAARRPAPGRPAGGRPRRPGTAARSRTTPQREPRRPRGRGRRDHRRRRPAPRQPGRRSLAATHVRPGRRAPRSRGDGRAERGPAPRRAPTCRRRCRGRRRATVGVAATSDALHEDRLVAAHAEARRCLDTLVRLGRRGDVSDPAGLGVARLLLGDNDPEHVGLHRGHGRPGARLGRAPRHRAGGHPRGVVRQRRAPQGHRGRAARAPQHRTQRLERIGELLGADWREPGRALDLQLALRLAGSRRLTLTCASATCQDGTVASLHHVRSVTRFPTVKPMTTDTAPPSPPCTDAGRW